MKTPRAASPFRTRLPKQIQRALPISIAASLLFVLFLWRHDSFRSSPIVADALKHVLPLQPLSISSHEFPKKIWQLWKVDPFSFEERDLARAKSWTAINPEYRYEVLTDGNDMNYVETHFGRAGLNRLDIVSTYRSLTAKIIKADLLRYLVMYIEGGVYADIDVESIRPIDGFIPPQYNPKDVDLVVGVEIDEPDFKGHRILGPKSQSFCQWTFMAKPRVPVMLKLVDNIVKWLHDVARRQNVPVSEIVLDFDEGSCSLFSFFRFMASRETLWSCSLPNFAFLDFILVLPILFKTSYANITFLNSYQWHRPFGFYQCNHGGDFNTKWPSNELGLLS